MLMFITHPSSRWTITEEVQMALEGGCRWIQLRLKDASDEEFRAVAADIIPLCKEANAFLVFDDRVELAMEMGVHGVHLGKDDMPPREARELMGAEAIIGVTANTAEDILALRGLDVDYVGLGPFRYTSTKSRLSPLLGVEGYTAILSRIRAEGIELPVAAIGGITVEDIPLLISAGVNGIAMSGAIINAPDPVGYTAEVVDILQK
ncbi:MAG: thiamine phosphate synthase [Duncaniella sp.]|nr:thiamine phosphate synthase [Duncaniella sp.]